MYNKGSCQIMQLCWMIWVLIAHICREDIFSNGIARVQGRDNTSLLFLFYGHSLPSADSRRAVVSFCMAKECAQYWLTAPVNVWLGKLAALDMTPLGCLGHKTSTQNLPLGLVSVSVVRTIWNFKILDRE